MPKLDAPGRWAVAPYFLTSVLIAILSMWAGSKSSVEVGEWWPAIQAVMLWIGPLCWVATFIVAGAELGKKAHWLWLTFPFACAMPLILLVYLVVWVPVALLTGK